MFVLKNTDHGKYVARPGSEHSYTHKLEEAQIFAKREHAENHRCRDSEIVVELDTLLLGKPRPGQRALPLD